MTSDGIALAAIVILLFPMGYFFLAAPAFLLVKLDIAEVTQLLRGMFSIHFLMMSVAGVIGTVVFAVTGRPVFAIGIGLLAAFAVWGRGWFLRQWDAQLSARDAGDACFSPSWAAFPMLPPDRLDQPVARMSEARCGAWTRMSRSFSSGARSRDPLAHPGYTCSEIVMHSESRPINANTLKLLKVDSSSAVQRIFVVKAAAVGAGHG
jgi:hypothetical protein